jgi:hypothetical protein
VPFFVIIWSFLLRRCGGLPDIHRLEALVYKSNWDRPDRHRFAPFLLVIKPGGTHRSTNFPAFSASLPEAICCHSEVNATAARGYVAKYLGDGLMAYFGWPEAHENDAERAVRTGLAIIESISKLNDHLAGLRLSTWVRHRFGRGGSWCRRGQGY